MGLQFSDILHVSGMCLFGMGMALEQERHHREYWGRILTINILAMGRCDEETADIFGHVRRRGLL